MMLHERLHQLNDDLIDVKSILKASEILIEKHIALIEKTNERVNSIQDQIDEAIKRSLV